MAMPMYQGKTIIDTSVPLDTESIKEKSVIVTGGAAGLGRAYVKSFVDAGAYVTFGDLNEDNGHELASELPGKAQFVKCDVRSWDDQVQLFEAAVSNSPSKSCDIVIANAGITGPDGLSAEEDIHTDPSLPPVKPDTKILDTNILGELYTTKLAIHYFRRQPVDPKRDRCLILMGSLSGYFDLPGSAQYSMSKFAIRALMRSLRRSSWCDSRRVNLVAPTYIPTESYPHEFLRHLKSCGIKLGQQDDACKAVMRIASDRGVNGRTLAVLSREDCPQGYVDFAQDDYEEGTWMRDLQDTLLNLSP
ncbi:hypothetical protein AJ80_03086 [Polytolypa hystricis UAMH7299]|uniref:Uncharacterized protein n=1 Tax=Polytolypa hystricis (strain UAMH7299) TaxID=1447883 RepID=A0A2B7YKV8_POLH7|nr:hypothetical protein AJ80_03086 [Polytolypa hystricis UAMH7299]